MCAKFQQTMAQTLARTHYSFKHWFHFRVQNFFSKFLPKLKSTKIVQTASINHGLVSHLPPTAQYCWAARAGISINIYLYGIVISPKIRWLAASPDCKQLYETIIIWVVGNKMSTIRQGGYGWMFKERRCWVFVPELHQLLLLSNEDTTGLARCNCLGCAEKMMRIIYKPSSLIWMNGKILKIKYTFFFLW